MVLEGQFEVPASREMVWSALNDAAILQKCIVGCESMEKLSDSEFRATIRFKLGPIRALFNTAIELRDVVPLEAYTLVVKGKGGVAGMGEGILNVTLDEQNELTTLEYAVEMKVYGKLAQVGARLMKNTIQKLSEEFFSRFSAQFDPGCAGSVNF